MKNTTFNAIDLIIKKRNRKELSDSEIKNFIHSYLRGSIEDSQVSAFLMAALLNGLNKKETYSLTKYMLQSGTVYKNRGIQYVDKHSTGGVGDKTSLIILPIAASLGVKVPMIAGRGLGHTTGTVDKFEAIPGLSCSLSTREFKKCIQVNNGAIIGQTNEIAPADKKIYSLRNITGTVESIPLIAASIMSKKLAEGISGLVLDIKCGDGAFMQKIQDAKKLSLTLKEIGESFGKKMHLVISNMNQPLGNAIGHSLEVIESIEVLKGNGPNDLRSLSLELAAAMIFLAGKSRSLEEGLELAEDALVSGRALEKLSHIIKLQKGNPAVIEDYSLLPAAKINRTIYSTSTGYIQKIQCKKLGCLNADLGGNRLHSYDCIDFGAGIYLHKKVGDYCKRGEPLATLYYNDPKEYLIRDLAPKFQRDYFQFSISSKVKKEQLIIQRLS